MSATNSNEMYPGDDRRADDRHAATALYFRRVFPPVSPMISDFYKLFDKRSTFWDNNGRGKIFFLRLAGFP